MSNQDANAPWHELSAFQRDLLVAIDDLDGEPCGLDIRAHLASEYGLDHANQINHGRLYPNLDALVGMGLVQKGSADSRTNFYVLTSRGRRELEKHREWMGA